MIGNVVRIWFERYFQRIRTGLNADSHRRNPYAAPATVADGQFGSELNVHGTSVRNTWVRRLIVVQAVVIVLALGLEAYEHRTIVGTGQIFTFIGLVIAVIARRHHDRAAVLFGVSAFLFASLIVFLINYHGWSPAQGDRPITILSLIYAAFALPTAIWLVFPRRVQPSG